MRILAVDSNSIMNRAYYGIKVLTTKDGFFTNAIYGFLNILLSSMAEVKPDAVVFAFDVHAPTTLTSSMPCTTRAARAPRKRSNRRAPWEEEEAPAA